MLMEESARLAYENEMLRFQLQSYSAGVFEQSAWWQPSCAQTWCAPNRFSVDASTNAGSSAIDSCSESESAWESEKETTKIMKNVPLDFTREQLIGVLDEHGFQGKYNFVYLPVNFRTSQLYGYAFVNFTCEAFAEDFESQFNGFSEWGVPSELTCEVKSSAHQGLNGNIMRYRNSPVMHESVDEQWRPVLFSDGVRIPFPPPTKSIKPPRTQRRTAKACDEHDD